MKPNPVVHFEMPYENHERLIKFYSATFGWSMQKLGSEMQDYVLAGTAEMDKDMMIKEPGSINGGFFPKESSPYKYPSVVISVENLQDAMKRVTDSGGQLHDKPMDIPGIGKFIAITDTEGNRLGMLEPIKNMQKT
jgi:predicted enzyme related to lactoylglutathione lyase